MAQAGGLLLSGVDAVEYAIGQMQQDLPAIAAHDTKDTPLLAQLHLSSASNLMKTIRILAPSAFPTGCTSPDQALLLQLGDSQLQVVTCLIELQLFHLQRAAALVAHAKQQLRKPGTQAQCLVRCHQQAAAVQLSNSGVALRTQHVAQASGQLIARALRPGQQHGEMRIHRQ